MGTPRIDRCLEAGNSILVATVNAQNAPSCCRAIALRSTDDLATVTVYLPMATSQQIIQDVATTHRMAVAATHIIDHTSTQLKGTATTARVAGVDEMAFVKSRLDAFADVIESIGVPGRTGRTLAHWPAFAVEIKVDEIFDQTPGPKAGTRLK
jgi:hypothetical protein